MSSSSAPSWSDAAGAAGAAADQHRVFSLIIPPSWRAIEFISDLHLSPDTPRTVAAFEAYLHNSRADAIVILGDLFEVWIGDDVTEDGFARRCLSALHDAAGTRTIAMMVGNRDFLVGADLLASHGVIALSDPTLLEAFSQRVVLAHGDALCLGDTEYQVFRRQVRAPSWQAAFLAKPRTERAAMARSMRDASEARKGQPMTTWADADPAATIALLDAFDSRTLIHGHTHRPYTHMPAVDGAANGSTRYVLSDWDLDGGGDGGGVPRAEVLRVTPAGFERVAL